MYKILYPSAVTFYHFTGKVLRHCKKLKHCLRCFVRACCPACRDSLVDFGFLFLR